MRSSFLRAILYVPSATPMLPLKYAVCLALAREADRGHTSSLSRGARLPAYTGTIRLHAPVRGWYECFQLRVR